MDGKADRDFYADPANLVPAGPGRRRQRPVLTSMISVRFDPAVIGAVKDVAVADGVTVGSWIRRQISRVLAERQRVAWLDAHRHELEVVPGSGRLVAPRDIPPAPSIARPRSFACQHMSVSGVVSASCGTCGPMSAAA